jgi:hypothetical protein
VQLTPPKEPVKNVEYRKALRRWAIKSSVNREWLMEKCRTDFFFWLESFAWIFEPRPDKGRNSVIPFIPWVSQVPVFNTIREHLGYKDIGIEKARGEGATWICIAIFVHEWLFSRKRQAFGMVSKDELSADNPIDPDSLGAKVDFLMEMMPLWMTGVKGKDWERNVSRHTWINRANGSTIVALATTGDMASGGRKTAMLMDEFAKFKRGDDEDALSATEPVTDCRILVSTYKGTDGAYYRAMKEDSSMIRVRMPWMANPTRNQSMFSIDGSTNSLRDPVTKQAVLEGEYTEKFFSEVMRILDNRGFLIDSPHKTWSPWYVSRCLRPRMTPQKIAQEYDMNPEVSAVKFFPPEVIERLCAHTLRPNICGEFEYTDELRFRRFLRSNTGRFKLWFPLDGPRAHPPIGNYVVGADIASGNGTCWTSNSALSVVNRETGRKVAEFASHTVGPEKLAELAVAVCRWFVNSSGGPAYLIWEGNGWGGGFRERVFSSDFRNFHWRTPVDSSKKKPTKIPGFWSTPASKRLLLEKYRWALSEGYFDNPSEDALRECLAYEDTAGNKVEYISVKGRDQEDPSNTGHNHGDRCIADALANYGMEALGGGAAVGEKKARVRQMAVDPPEGSFAHRRKLSRSHRGETKGHW